VPFTINDEADVCDCASIVDAGDDVFDEYGYVLASPLFILLLSCGIVVPIMQDDDDVDIEGAGDPSFIVISSISFILMDGIN
jgi:hypothetical protein